jgi:hypothetical protein
MSVASLQVGSSARAGTISKADHSRNTILICMAARVMQLDV